MKKKLFSILIVLTLMIIFPVNAKEVNGFYSNSGDNVKVEDTIKGDSAIAGKIIDLLGNFDGIAFAAGDTINVNGTLEYGFVAGSSINVNGNISKGIYAAGRDISFSKDAKVSRDAFLAGKNVTLEGTLERDVYVGANSVTIKSGTTINGNVSLDTEKLTVEDNVTIKGTLKYNKDAKTTISDSAKIGNTVTYKSNEKTTPDISLIIGDTVISAINMIVVFVVLATIIPSALPKASNKFDSFGSYLKGFGFGILILLCTPIIALLLLISSVGSSLGIILALLYGIAIYLSFIAFGYLLGYLITTKLLKKEINSYFTGIIGIVLLKLLMVVPYIGGFVAMIALFVGLYTVATLCLEDKKKQA